MFQETDHAASDIKEHREQECKNRIALLKNEKKQSGDQHAKCHDDIESTNVGITSGGNAVQSADHSFVCKETKRYDRKKSENHTEYPESWSDVIILIFFLVFDFFRFFYWLRSRLAFVYRLSVRIRCKHILVTFFHCTFTFCTYFFRRNITVTLPFFGRFLFEFFRNRNHSCF